ncbi:MAG: hypothetical protein DSM106950_34585 [Stigonema ocellatum SAG 48.90 = DSM 106950]|nr:hypothetical protein [Stigonema ocellatum SAG 48.90 = DSM 106950]
MNKLVLAVLATALGTAATVTFPQSANADYPYHHRSGDYREYHRYYRGEDRPHYDRREYYHGYYPHRYYREYYPPRYYDRGYYYPHSRFQFVVPLIIR